MGFGGPNLETGVKFASENKREFTEEQLAAQREMSAAGTAINQGSAAVMERSGVQKTGGSPPSLMLATQCPCSGCLQLVQKTLAFGMQTGITFGNDQSGSGEAGLTAVSAGSAGIMERSGVQKTGESPLRPHLSPGHKMHKRD